MREPLFRIVIVGIVLACAMPLTALAQDAGGADAGAGGAQDGIFLLEPIAGIGRVPTQGGEGLGAFQFYFGLLYPWVIGMGAGIAVFMGVIGGIQIIQAGSDAAGVTNGKNRLLLSLAGLLIILGSAAILNALNPTFFR